jgi:hypothetical protein
MQVLHRQWHVLSRAGYEQLLEVEVARGGGLLTIAACSLRRRSGLDFRLQDDRQASLCMQILLQSKKNQIQLIQLATSSSLHFNIQL